jgi:serine phosphatase RsbU (regulator of sigma subunit)
MVLMPDGVVEARSKTGELYGLDRLAQLTLQSA